MISTKFLAAVLLPGLLCAQAGRESVLDRKVHPEPVLIQEVPEVPRLCETLAMKGRKIDVGGCRLYVEEEGAGAPVVLINGGPGGTHHGFHPWFGQAAAFARVVYYDQRGCGLSDWTPGPGYSVEQAVEDLEGLRKALGYPRWTVLGWSYGGFLAQLYAIRYPEHTTGLVLVGASPGLDPDFGSRQWDFLAPEETAHLRRLYTALGAARKERGLDHPAATALRIFNLTLNGDWKRQSFYRPTREAAARLARYEWNNPPEFNSDISETEQRYHLAGAFQSCPIPTLIVEGRWDLTWGPEKAGALLANHPGARMQVFEQAGHGVFNEDPEGFFKTLRTFQSGLQAIEPARLRAYQAQVAPWRKQMDHPIPAIHWGLAASKSIRARDRQAWLADHPGTVGLLRLGFAQYDGQAFEAALQAFREMEAQARADKKSSSDGILALLWQGHALDLLGRREEAVACYRRVAERNSDQVLSNGQYRLSFKASEYARTRMEKPFTYQPNQDPD